MVSDTVSRTYIEGGLWEARKFALSYQFYSKKDAKVYEYSKGVFEGLANGILFFQEAAADKFLKEIRNPVAIISLTLLGILGTSIGFYPERVRNGLFSLFPAVSGIEAWMLKFGLYMLVESTIFGLGLRAFGRFGNPDLIEAYNKKKIIAVPLGSKPASQE